MSLLLNPNMKQYHSALVTGRDLPGRSKCNNTFYSDWLSIYTGTMEETRAYRADEANPGKNLWHASLVLRRLNGWYEIRFRQVRDSGLHATPISRKAMWNCLRRPPSGAATKKDASRDEWHHDRVMHGDALASAALRLNFSKMR